MNSIGRKLTALFPRVFSNKHSRTTGVSDNTSGPSYSRDDLNAAAPFFDTAFYMSHYPDVADSGLSAIEHYLSKGWHERRDPSRFFSTGFYLDNYPDISENNLNPLIHYAIAGQAEGRRPREGAAIPLQFSRDPKTVTGCLGAIGRLESPSATSTFPSTPNPNRLRIHWVIPDFSRGGGGHMTIFRMVRLLESFGHECTIWIFFGELHKHNEDAYDDIVKYFQCVGAEVKITNDGIITSGGDALIATSWQTVYPVSIATGFNQKFYFVQDHEPEFYPTGTESILAKESYKFDLACICAGKWLEEIMSQRYSRWARSFELAFDHAIYKVLDDSPTSNKGKLKIAVYARDGTARRCVQLALLALEKLARVADDFEVHFFGQERLPFAEVNYQAWNHGVLDGAELARLYNDCDLGICFSATNYSLVPQEMMACGLPLVELDSDSTRAIFPEGVVTLAGPHPESIATELLGLMRSSTQRRVQAERALEWVQGLTWKAAAERVESALLERMNLVKTSCLSPENETLLDVVIPTFNGLGEIERVINALRSQSLYSKLAIYCIDSSSNDGTTEWLKNQPDILTLVIPQNSFQHGRTRNLGASLGKSPFIAFLTQDAIPATENWAHDIIQLMNHYSSAAGLFGRHLPYPHHPRHIKDEINAHFDGMLKYPLLLSKHTDQQKWDSNDTSWRQLLHYYSDNNSCMRRTTWEMIPYPEVDFGEDQLWAKKIIEMGHSKIYAPTATVFHSHDFGAQDTYKRSKTEGYFFYKHFGYELAPVEKNSLEKVIFREQDALVRQLSSSSQTENEVTLRKEIIANRHLGWFNGMKEAMQDELQRQP